MNKNKPNKTYLMTGQMQGGKTTEAVRVFNEWLSELNTYPITGTFGRNHILEDFKRKMIKGGVSAEKLVVPGKDRAAFKLIKDMIFAGVVPNDVGVFGLHNHAFHDKIASSILHNHAKTKFLLDEYDTGQVGFHEDHIDLSIKQDHAIDSYIRKGVLEELWLISATNLQGAIADLNYDDVINIAPGKGYKGRLNFDFEPLYDDDIESLLQGIPNKKIKSRVWDSEGHVMFNLDRLTKKHESIAQAVSGFGDTMILNSNNNFDISSLEDRSKKKIVIGGDVFARGATFPNVSSLFFFKPESHMAVKLQAVGRLFGYKDMTLKLYCTKREQYQIEKMLELNEKFSDRDFLMKEYQIRHEEIAQICLPDDMKIFNPRKANGFNETTWKPDIDKPKFTIPVAPDEGDDIYMLQTKHVAEPTEMPKKGLATYKWGESPEHMQRSMINAHPFTGSPLNRSQGGPRRFVVPPRVVEGYVDYCEYPEQLESGHWYIENKHRTIEELKAIKSEFIGTYGTNGKVKVWKNIWPEDAKTETVISRKTNNS